MSKILGVLHIYIHSKIIEKCNPLIDGEIIIKVDKFRRFLGWHNIPKELQMRFISEMKELGLIEIKDYMNVILKKVS